LTTSNPNVLYELGVRHTARPGTTLTIYADSTPLPFDVNLLRARPYQLGDHNQFGEPEAAALRTLVTSHFIELLQADGHGAPDSPLYQLLPTWNPTPLPELDASAFRADAREAERIKKNSTGSLPSPDSKTNSPPSTNNSYNCAPGSSRTLPPKPPYS
jgi:hypothetical protein